MPSKSKKQHNLMAAVAHNPAFAKKVGIPVSVGKEFSDADKGKKFGSGGRADLQKINAPKTKHGQDAILNKGGIIMAKTGPNTMAKDVEAGSNKLLKFGESAVQKRGHTKGKNLGDSGSIVGIESGGMKKGGKVTKMCGGGKMKKMAKGGTASARADGIASKGKTKGKFC